MRLYWKFVAQVAATVAVVVAAAVAGDGRIDASEWGNVLLSALGAVAVLGAGNLPAGIWSHSKALVSAATAAVMLWQSSLGDSVTTAEWWQIGLAFLGALGVFAVPGPVVYQDPAAAGAAGAGLRPGPIV